MSFKTYTTAKMYTTARMLFTRGEKQVFIHFDECTPSTAIRVQRLITQMHVKIGATTQLNGGREIPYLVFEANADESKQREPHEYIDEFLINHREMWGINAWY